MEINRKLRLQDTISKIFYKRYNGNEVRLVGTPLDRDIIDECLKSNKHLKFDIPFPQGIKYYQFEDWKTAVEGVDFVIGGVFPMLCHAAAVLDEGKDAHLPWEAFTFDQTK